VRYSDAIAWVYSLQPRGIRLELERMRSALALAGNPQASLRVVHVAGTNGKGSTSAILERALRAGGHRTGLYTSPHLHTFGERIRIAGKPLGRPEIARRLTAAHELLAREGAPMLTFFEVATLIAFQAFADHGCDVVVLEVGLGGRFDATNVVDVPLATAITSIAMDHESYLGTTIEAIASEKAGIAKAGVPLVVGTRDAAALAVIEASAAEVGAPLVRLGTELRVESEARGLRVTTPDGTVDRLKSSLAGAHQEANVGVAVATMLSLRAPGLTITDTAIRTGVRTVKWPGRLERITRESRPDVLLDAAHNPEGASALAAHLATLPRTARRVLVFGAMRDKAWRTMLASLAPQVDRAIYFSPALGRAEDASALFSGSPIPAEAAPDHVSALALAEEAAGEGGLVVVCGSIFVLAPIRAALLGLDADPPIAM
jgi:dihydrofolate synthase/folylpolyglutamate synthase